MSRRTDDWQARWTALPANLRGMLWAALAGFVFSLLNALMRALALDMHPFVVGFWRYFFGALVMLPLFWNLGSNLWRTQRPGSHVARSLIHTGGLCLWFYALPLIPIAETTALGFTTPLFITLGAVMFLGEKVRWRRWGALAVGFVGTIIILRPGVETLSLGAVLMLASAPLFAGSNLLAKSVAKTDSPAAIVGWQSTLITLFALPFALYAWEWPSWLQLGILLIGGILGTCGHLALSQSYKVADITAVQPIGFLSLVWAQALGFVMFGDIPDLWTWVGAAVIFSANTYIAHREAVRRGKPDLSGDAPPPAH